MARILYELCPIVILLCDAGTLWLGIFYMITGTAKLEGGLRARGRLVRAGGLAIVTPYLVILLVGVFSSSHPTEMINRIIELLTTYEGFVPIGMCVCMSLFVIIVGAKPG